MDVVVSRARESTLRPSLGVLAATFSILIVGLAAGGANGQGTPDPRCAPTRGGGNLCVLNPSVSNALLGDNSTNRITATGDVFVNSTSASASNFAGAVTAHAIGGRGTPTTAGSYTPPWRQVSGPDNPDPYANAPAPDHLPCDGTYPNATGNPRNPGGYNNFTWGGGGTPLTLNPGVYTITGSFSITGGTQHVIGYGVTLYFCPSATWSTSGGGTGSWNLSAPRGPTDFVIYFAGTNSNNLMESRINLLCLTGIFYAPNSGPDLRDNGRRNFVNGDVVANRVRLRNNVPLTLGAFPTDAGCGEVPPPPPPDEGELEVTKAISGDGAGLQGRVVIGVTCGGHAESDFVIPEHAEAGPHYSRLFGPFPEGTSCTVRETESGANGAVSVETMPSGPQMVTIAPGETRTVHFTDTFSKIAANEGFLQVVKRISGNGAGLQGKVVIKVECGKNFSTEFVVPAHAAAGSHESPQYGPFPEGTSCTVQETAENGENSAVSVHTVGSPTTVTIGEATVEGELPQGVPPRAARRPRPAGICACSTHRARCSARPEGAPGT
jgi:hypothetical protein